MVKLEIWDTAGQDRYESLVPLYYKKVDIAIIVYDTTCQETFKKSFEWINKIKQDVKNLPVFIVLGNKIDMANRFIDYNVAKLQVESIGAIYIECSAKTCNNVDEAFIVGCDIAIQRVLSQPMRDISLGSSNSDEISEFVNLYPRENKWDVSYCCS